ncbi:NADP-dependent oxidoreductase [Furfurilactobacillus sp. WILCCON 0119]
MTNTMTALVVDRPKQPAKLTTVSVPTVGPHDVLVAIRAASVNPVDTRLQNNQIQIALPHTPTFPMIMGNDFAGTIMAVGDQVTAFNIGDDVYSRPRDDRSGTFAQYIAARDTDLALKPSSLTYEEAAAVPLVSLTAYQALHDLMALKPGQKVLIQAGAGGVGTSAIQIAKQLGAYVATTTSAANQQLVKNLGADEVIDYHTTNFDDVIHDYDAVFDTLGGDALMAAFKVVKPGGIVVSIAGMPDADYARREQLGAIKTTLFGLVSRKITRAARRAQVRYAFLIMHESGDQLALLTDLIDRGQFHPVMDRDFPLAEATEALAYSASGHATGKITISMPD